MSDSVCATRFSSKASISPCSSETSDDATGVVILGDSLKVPGHTPNHVRDLNYQLSLPRSRAVGLDQWAELLPAQLSHWVPSPSQSSQPSLLPNKFLRFSILPSR